MDILSVNANRRQPPTPMPDSICGAKSTEGHTCVRRPADHVAKGEPNHYEQHMFYFWTDQNPTAEGSL